jgi:DNA-binding FadR family transcriptional regulator
VRAFIEERIREGQWPAGHQLPTERELVEHFGIARNTVRKTLRALEERGTIERHVGRGTFVASPREADEPDLVQRIHRASPAEIMEARLLIEPDVVGLAAARASADDLAAMEECLRRAESAPSVDEFEHWDGRLHETILGAARNGLIADIYAAINSVRRQAEWRKLKERTRRYATAIPRLHAVPCATTSARSRRISSGSRSVALRRAQRDKVRR